MAYNNLVSRTDASALIPEDVAGEVITKATEQSAALSLFRRVPVSRGQLRMPILSALPTAYFVNGDTGLKQTSEVNWANKFLNIEEIAVIMPVPEAVFEDADYDIWQESLPLLSEAIGRAFDAAVFFGTNAPASYPTSISASAAAAGNSVTEAATAAQGGAFGDLDATIATLEDDGFDVSGWAAARSLKARLRAARSTQGEGLDRDRVSTDLTTLDGAPISYAMRGLYPSGGAAGTNVRAFAMDASEFVVGVRRDITLKMLDQAVIQDNTGAIIYNLAQQDMVAARLTFRAGWQVSNVVNYQQPTDASRYPAAVLKY